MLAIWSLPDCDEFIVSSHRFLTFIAFSLRSPDVAASSVAPWAMLSIESFISDRVELRFSISSPCVWFEEDSALEIS